MNSKTLPQQMNGVFDVHFVITKVTNKPQSIYDCQIIARHQYHTDSLNIATPGILVVQPPRNCITLFNSQVEFINDKYSYPKSIDKDDYTKADKVYYNLNVFTLKRIDLLTEMAEVVFDKLVTSAAWNKDTCERNALTKLVEPLFTITEEGLDEMIRRNLTLKNTNSHA